MIVRWLIADSMVKESCLSLLIFDLFGADSGLILHPHMTFTFVSVIVPFDIYSQNRSTSSSTIPSYQTVRYEWITNRFATLKKLASISGASLSKKSQKNNVRRTLSVKIPDNESSLQFSSLGHRSRDVFLEQGSVCASSPTDLSKSVQIRAENKRVSDTRRWSLASLPSSRYETQLKILPEFHPYVTVTPQNMDMRTLYGG